jgi:mevalonate kinase
MKIMAKTQSVAPGKLILSGEHSVVYGNPALVMATNRYVTTTVQPQAASQITFHFPDLKGACNLTFEKLIQVKNRLRENYQRFIENHLNIGDVLQEPIELAQFVLSLLLEAAGITSLKRMNINIQSDIPMGCGMGSSAAAILSMLSAIAHYLQISLSPELFFNLAQTAENIQHGHSSGLDLLSSMRGGCLYVKKDTISPRTPPALPLYIMNTGQPQVTTGDCVATVAPYFNQTDIGNDFAAVTDAMDQAFQCNKMSDVITAIRENHKLLNTIGVVPLKEQQMIADIEQKGGAAKISGAGAVAGDKAGIVLIAMEDENVLQKIARHYQQIIIPVQCESRGVRVN